MKKILVLDDNSEMLLLVRVLLSRYGYLVESVTHSSGLLKKIKQFDPGLLIIDIHLEDGDGRDICRKLKDNPLTCHIPIILFSGDPSIIKDYQECNADDFITKPFDKKMFVANVKKIFDRNISNLI
jgi:DNA-binding response OmpR family regulator